MAVRGCFTRDDEKLAHLCWGKGRRGEACHQLGAALANRGLRLIERDGEGKQRRHFEFVVLDLVHRPA